MCILNVDLTPIKKKAFNQTQFYTTEKINTFKTTNKTKGMLKNEF